MHSPIANALVIVIVSLSVLTTNKYWSVVLNSGLQLTMTHNLRNILTQQLLPLHTEWHHTVVKTKHNSGLFMIHVFLQYSRTSNQTLTFQNIRAFYAWIVTTMRSWTAKVFTVERASTESTPAGYCVFLSDLDPGPESQIFEKQDPDWESLFNFDSSKSLRGHFFSENMGKFPVGSMTTGVWKGDGLSNLKNCRIRFKKFGTGAESESEKATLATSDTNASNSHMPVSSEISDFTPCAHAQNNILHIEYADKTDDLGLEFYI